MNNKIVCVDIDDCLANLCQDATTLCNRLTGKTIHPADWHTYDVESIFGIPEEEYFQAVVKTKMLENLQPVYGAQAALNGLYSSGYTIHYVTARSWHPDAYNVTQEWLRYHRFSLFKPAYQDCIHIVPLGCNKAQYVREHINPDSVAIAVDDSPQQVKNYLDSNLCSYVFLVDQPWNRAYGELDLHRIHQLSHLNNPYKFYN